MKLRTPWIVTGSLAALAAAGGIGAALAEPAQERELTPVTTRPVVPPSPAVGGSPTPMTDPGSPGSSALTAASPVAVSAASPVVVSAPSPARAPAPAPAASPASADSGWSAPSADSGD